MADPRYKLVIFDFDGTLADSFPWFVSVMNDVARKFRFKEVRDDEVELLRSYETRKILAHLGVPFWKLPLIARHLRALKARDIESISLFSGVDELLRGLSEAGSDLAIVSSNSYSNVSRILGPGNSALIGSFECSVSMFGKRARIRKLLRRAALPGHEAIYIGDETRDIEAARAEGIASGAVTWGYNRVESLRPLSPTAIFERLDEILHHCRR